jgi:hypothetical protein
MDRKKLSLKSGVVGLNPAEQRQVRGGTVAPPPRRSPWYAALTYRNNIAGSSGRDYARTQLLGELNVIK